MLKTYIEFGNSIQLTTSIFEIQLTVSFKKLETCLSITDFSLIILKLIEIIKDSNKKFLGFILLSTSNKKL